MFKQARVQVQRWYMISQLVDRQRNVNAGAPSWNPARFKVSKKAHRPRYHCRLSDAQTWESYIPILLWGSGSRPYYLQYYYTVPNSKPDILQYHEVSQSYAIKDEVEAQRWRGSSLSSLCPWLEDHLPKGRSESNRKDTRPAALDNPILRVSPQPR